MGFNPCVKCGCDFIVTPVATEGGIGKRARYLGSCACSKDVGGYSSRESFIKDWNRRNPLPTDEEAYKAVEEETKPLCQQCLRENEDGDDHLCTLCRGKEWLSDILYEEAVFWEEGEELRDSAPKNDQDVYEKVDLSLIPWDILSDGYEDGTVNSVMFDIHQYLNGGLMMETIPNMRGMLNAMITDFGVLPLAQALGYGARKYYRDSWQKGFGGDVKRIFEALLRHGDKYQRGEEFDGEAIGEYTKGTSHIGAVMWGLMVAEQESKVDKT